MELKILSFSGKNFNFDDVVSVTLMTQTGEITILDKHSPLLTQVKPSTMFFVYKDKLGIERRDDFFVGNGVVEVSESRVKILVDVLVDIDDLDEEVTDRSKENAILLMEKYRDSKDRLDMEKFIEAEDLLVKSIGNLKLGKLKLGKL